MDNKHSILLEYYSKYNKNGGNVISNTTNRLLTKINPRVIMSLGKERYPTMVQNIKTLLREAGTDITDRAIDEISQNIAKDILQGNNPMQSFRKGIFNRLVEYENISPEQKKYFKNYLDINNLPSTPLTKTINFNQFNYSPLSSNLKYSNVSSESPKYSLSNPQLIGGNINI